MFYVSLNNDSWGFALRRYSDESWAFYDNFREPRFAAAGAALRALAEQGRGGKGTIVVQSAGNSFEFGDDTNLHNFQNSRYVITVAATDFWGQVTDYSSPGASVLVAAPGGDGGNALSEIITTDRSGAAGRDRGDYTAITGTSFSAPVVSGVVALMLEANPSLGWRDVQQILAYSARMIAPEAHEWRYNGAGNWNGGGLHYDAVDHDLGFGLVDARAAVRLAETWRGPAATSANDVEVSASRATPEAIVDHGTVRQSVTITQDVEIERIELTLDVRHSYVGDLAILLTSPSGTHSWLLWRAESNDHSPFGSDRDNINFTFTSVLGMGESALGEWRLALYDDAAGDTGTLRAWTLTLVGKPVSNDDVYFYSDEFAETLARDPARGLLRDSGGADTLNAATVTTASRIDLRPGARSSIDGATLTIAVGTAIEDAYGGDGDDEIIGNEDWNSLCGMRGNDRLMGGAGDDWIDGGAGIDTAVFALARSTYTLKRNSATWDVLSAAEGDDFLIDVERLQFADRWLALDLDGNAGSALKAIGALYGPRFLGSPQLLGRVLSLLDGSMSYASLVAAIVGTSSFADLAGSHSNTDFVRHVYKNVVGVDPPPLDLAYYRGLLDSGTFTQASLALLACETSLNVANVDLVGLAATGVEFLPPAAGG
jgi:subtilisin-like proprotein convertase family protein